MTQGMRQTKRDFLKTRPLLHSSFWSSRSAFFCVTNRLAPGNIAAEFKLELQISVYGSVARSRVESALSQTACQGSPLSRNLDKRSASARNSLAANTMLKNNSTAGKGKSRILLVDDHPIVRQGLAELINHEEDLFVCGTTETFHETLDQIPSLQPDLVLADISLKGGNDGIELLKNIKARHSKTLVLMLSMHDETLYALRALRAGAVGYIMKQEATEKVLTAIRQVLKGEIYLSEQMEKKLKHQLVGGRAVRTGSPIEDLSDRELQIFSLIGQGRSTRQIAEELPLSVKTVETHRAHIKEKLHLKSATELVQHAVQWRES